MRMLPVLAAVLAAAALLTAQGGISHHKAIAEGPCIVPADFVILDAEEQAALDAINAIRTQAGLVPLSVSPALMRAARWKALDLASGSPFAHDDSFRSWVQRLADCGYRPGGMYSENLAAGASTGAGAVAMWQDSPPHRANMLHPDIRYIGIARAPGGAYAWYWTANFGAAAGDAITADDRGSR